MTSEDGSVIRMEEGLLNASFLDFPSEPPRKKMSSSFLTFPSEPSRMEYDSLRQLETGFNQGLVESHSSMPFPPRQSIPHLEDYLTFPSSHPPLPLLHFETRRPVETGSSQCTNNDSRILQTFLPSLPPLPPFPSDSGHFEKLGTESSEGVSELFLTFPPILNNFDNGPSNNQFLKMPSSAPAFDSATVSIVNQDNTLGHDAGLQSPYLSEFSEVPFVQFPELSPVLLLPPTPHNECVATPGFPLGILPDLSNEQSYDIPLSQDYLNWDVVDMEVEKIEAVLKEEPELDKSQYSKPIYNKAPITLHESLVSILTMALKYSLSGQLIDSILGLIDLHLPKEDNIFQTSLYLFKKYFSEIRGHSSYTYYCSKCLEECEKSVGCLACGKKAPLCCLISLSLVDQLKALMGRKGFFSQLVPLQSRFHKSGYADIYDGDLYKDHIKRNFVGDLPDLTCEWYADGAEVFKSANISVWNLFFSINELPYSERYKKKNLLIPALWVGPVKPPTNLFLKVALPELRELASGVSMEVADLGRTEDVSLKVTGGTGDTPARALILNMVAHNGEHACQVCLQKGKCRDCSTVRVFPYDEDQMKARTVENFKSHGKWASALKKIDPTKAYMGVHGTTPLSQVCMDPVRGTGIDIMHNLWGGCGKLNLNFFVDSSSTYSSLPCHLNKLQRELVDEKLLQIKPPHYLTRIPKSIKEVGSWQTSIHKSMCLYYSLPVLEGIVREENFVHYSTLIAAAQIINSDVITDQDIDEADILIKKYVSSFPQLYEGDTYMTINIHLLLHLSSLVREKGPAWVTACFPLESVNGEILKLIHGPRYPEMQITSSLQMSLCLEDLVYNLPPGEPKEFCSALLSTTNKCKEIKLGENIIQGKWQHLPKQPPEYLQQLISTHPSLPAGFNITTFNSLRRRKILYAVESFRKTQARDSSAVLYNFNNTTRTGIIKEFIRASKCDCKTCVCDCELFAAIQELKVVAAFQTLVPGICVPNTHQYKRLQNFILLPVHDLLSVSVKMQIGSKLFISKRSNNHEIE